MTVASTPLGAESALPAGLVEDVAVAALALARRVHCGGTLWCAAPLAPSHAEDVAAELVRSGAAGLPALPAIALPSHELTATVRAGARGGDVLLVVGPAGNGEARELVRRAPAWGVLTLWIGAGARPEPGAADHVLWLPDDEPDVPPASSVSLCRLLGELTHLHREHPAALQPAADCDGPVCITCSDEGRLGEVVDATASTALVRTSAGVEEVDLSLVAPVLPDDLLVVHAGLAITRLTARP